MKHSSGGRSSLFLMELMIAILFFSLAGAVCLRVFTKAHLLSEGASDLNTAVVRTESVAELLKHSAAAGNDSFERLLRGEYPDTLTLENDGGCSIFFDEDWNHCKPGDDAYVMSVNALEEDAFTSYVIETFRTSGQTDGEDSSIYSITLKLHKAETAD